jgi:hypothetical protein
MHKDVRNAEDCPGPTTALSAQFDYEGETQLSAAAAHCPPPCQLGAHRGQLRC